MLTRPGRPPGDRALPGINGLVRTVPRFLLFLRQQAVGPAARRQRHQHWPTRARAGAGPRRSVRLRVPPVHAPPRVPPKGCFPVPARGGKRRFVDPDPTAGPRPNLLIHQRLAPEHPADPRVPFVSRWPPPDRPAPEPPRPGPPRVESLGSWGCFPPPVLAPPRVPRRGRVLHCRRGAENAVLSLRTRPAGPRPNPLIYQLFAPRAPRDPSGSICEPLASSRQAETGSIAGSLASLWSSSSAGSGGPCSFSRSSSGHRALVARW